MEKIYSKKNPSQLLHIIHRFNNITENRNDISPDEEYLQVGAFKTHKNKVYRPHIHLNIDRSTDITQESWVIMEGKIKVSLFDIDSSPLYETILEKGDCSITFRGGHGYECVEDNTVVYEFKTGPYMGQKKDKEWI